MNYGYWLQRTHRELADARDRLSSDPAASIDDVGAAMAARQQVYAGLARLVELVTGGQPARADIDRNTVDIALQHAGDHATLLYLGLTAAAGLDRREAPARAPACRPGRHLASAADALAVAGDILASHTPPIREPLTPEGVAIRAGAGYTAAIIDIADLTHAVLLVDASLPGWAAASHPLAEDVYEPTLARSRWAGGGRLAALTNRVMANGGNSPSLLRLLEVAPAPGARTPIIDGATARSALLAARDWMHRNVGEVRAAHLASGTRLGLAVSAVATPHAPGADWRSWSTAAHAASRLHGTPPHGAAADVAGDLDRLTRWVRPGAPRPGQLTGTGPRREAIDTLAAVLPSLAEVLRTAAARAARHGHFFVSEGRELNHVPRLGVFHAVTRWRVTDTNDDGISRLRSALYEAGASALASSPWELDQKAPRLAKLAFATAIGLEPSSRAGAPSDQTVQHALPTKGRREGHHR
ncbi:hypothetical protein WEI85_07715 [Actinomycetes bacterium KLBMP 9797]